MSELLYWLKGEELQNFGDYLTEYFIDRLFLETARYSHPIRIIGSVIENTQIAEADESAGTGALHSIDGARRNKLIAWGCGVREIGGVSAENRKAIETLAVRGPLTASELRLGADAPLGDPALLLPAIYRPSKREIFSGKAILAPHFLDSRSDKELLALTGADMVLRPNIRPSLTAVEEFIDALYSARFVLSGSLHGAIVAAAYGRPFAYWDSGNVDVPLKWRDFSESAKIPAVFVKTLAEGVAHYEAEIAPAIQLPSLWESLATAPFLPRPDSLLKVLLHDSGAEIGEEAHQLLARKIATFERRHEHFRQIADESGALVARLDKDAASLKRELAQREQEAAQRERQFDSFREQTAAEQAGLSRRIGNLCDEAAQRTRERDASRDALAEAERIANARQSELDSLRQQLADLYQSSSWRFAAPWRGIVAIVRSAGRALRKMLTRIALHRSGRPRRLTRKAFFHSDGRPRKWFRLLVVRKDGRPRREFENYVALRAPQARAKRCSGTDPAHESATTDFENETRGVRSAYRRLEIARRAHCA